MTPTLTNLTTRVIFGILKKNEHTAVSCLCVAQFNLKNCLFQAAVASFVDSRETQSAEPTVAEYEELLKDTLATVGACRHPNPSPQNLWRHIEPRLVLLQFRRCQAKRNRICVRRSCHRNLYKRSPIKRSTLATSVRKLYLKNMRYSIRQWIAYFCVFQLN